MRFENKKCCRTIELHLRKHQRTAGEFHHNKGKRPRTRQGNHDPGILRFKSLLDRISVVGKRRKGESEQSGESTDRREAVESRAKRPLLFDQNIRTKDEESPSLDFDPNLSTAEIFGSGSESQLLLVAQSKTHRDAITQSVIENAAQNNWKAAVNVIFKHPACQDFLEEAVRSTISREFKEYCHSNTSVLKYTPPSELTSFSNTLVRHEIKTICPLWNSTLEGALRPYKNETKMTRATNVSALLYTAAAAKFRNSRISAFAHRVSVILLHSGGKSHDFTRLNTLGICKSHTETISKQGRTAITSFPDH